MQASVLLVDDERFARTLYADYLRAAGYAVEVAENAPAAVRILEARRFDVLVTDIVMPGGDGLQLLADAKRIDPNIQVVVITALDRVDPAVRAMRAGASDYLVKPVTPEAIQLSVQRSLSTRALLAENTALRGHVNLFETCQRITGTLDRDKVVPLALPALAAECGASGAALLEREGEEGWHLSGLHGIASETAGEFLAPALPRLAELTPDATGSSTCPPPPATRPRSASACRSPTARSSSARSACSCRVRSTRSGQDARPSSAGTWAWR